MASRRSCSRILLVWILSPCWITGISAWVASTSRKRSQGRWIANYPSTSRTLRGDFCREKPSRTRTTRRFLSSSSSSSVSKNSPSSSKRSRDKVVYQKVVQSQDDEFITSLVDHLESFQLPSNLPMVYDMTVSPTLSADNGEDDTTQESFIVQWDSPLSPSPDATRMRVQLVAIASSSEDGPTQQSTNSAAPFSMAMVVVQKTASSHSSMPAMMKNLFEDSEKRIIKSFDRSLQDFVQTYSSQAAKITKKQRQMQQEMLEELLDDIDESSQSQEPLTFSPQSSLKDAINVEIVEAPSDDLQRAAVLETMQRPAIIPNSPKSAQNSSDFAIQAAKDIAQKQPTASQGDFAVAAAKRAAAKATAATTPKTKVKASDSEAAHLADEAAASSSTVRSNQEMVDWSNQRPPVLTGDKQFMSISKPADFAARKSAATKMATNMDTNQVMPHRQSPSSSVEQSHTAERLAAVEQATPAGLDGNIFSSVLEEPDDSVDAEIDRTTGEALAEMSGQDISPEDLLQSVMQFGDQQEQVFATGALEKAKELLREQRQHREEYMRSTAELDMIADEAQNIPGVVVPELCELSVDEELRQMFQAGERLADNAITTVKEQSKLSEADEQRVDSIIADDKSGMPNYARNLDDDLVELAARLNKSPGEDMDGPRKHPIFDVFSGPEVYNPNVDPETAVNWPGAMPGDKSRLSNDLQAAVSNARFAADVLSKLRETDAKYFIGQKELSAEQVRNLQMVVEEAVEVGLIPDPIIIESERARLRMVIDELWEQPDERVQAVASTYKELLLSENFASLVRERLNEMATRDLDALRRDDETLKQAHERERDVLASLVGYTQLLLKETRALGAQLEASHLEVVRSICRVAMDPSHQTEEDTAMALTDAVRDMRPLFDDSFVAYLKYAVAEEEGRLARAGLLDDPDHNQWLFVLQIVQQGVYAELGKGLSRYIDHIMYVLRMESAIERTMLLQKLIDVMPTLDVRPFVRVVDSIVGSLGDSVSGNFNDATELGEMTNRLLQLNRDVKRLLPPERIALMSKDADDWAAKQKERLLKNRELSMQRLRAAEETEYLENELESLGSGEFERIE